MTFARRTRTIFKILLVPGFIVALIFLPVSLGVPGLAGATFMVVDALLWIGELLMIIGIAILGVQIESVRILKNRFTSESVPEKPRQVVP